jgi:hypothetical protein
MAKFNKDLPWEEIDPETLPAEVAKQYDAYKALYAAAMEPVKAARAKFEEAATKARNIPHTHRLVFSYNFGRLNIALDVASKSKAGSKAVSFASIKV